MLFSKQNLWQQVTNVPTHTHKSQEHEPVGHASRPVSICRKLSGLNQVPSREREWLTIWKGDQNFFIFSWLLMIFLIINFLQQLCDIWLQDVFLSSPPVSAASRPGLGPTDWRLPRCWEKVVAGSTPLVPGWVLSSGSPSDPWAEPAAPPHGTPPLTGSQGSLTGIGKNTTVANVRKHRTNFTFPLQIIWSLWETKKS